MTYVNHRDILHNLRELSDVNYRRRLWTNQIPAAMSDFVECTTQLFHGTGLDGIIDGTSGVYGHEIDRDLARLHALVADVDGYRSPGEIIDDPALVPVTELSGSILPRLQQLDLPNVPLDAPSTDPVGEGPGTTAP